MQKRVFILNIRLAHYLMGIEIYCLLNTKGWPYSRFKTRSEANRVWEDPRIITGNRSRLAVLNQHYLFLRLRGSGNGEPLTHYFERYNKSRPPSKNKYNLYGVFYIDHNHRLDFLLQICTFEEFCHIYRKSGQEANP